MSKNDEIYEILNGEYEKLKKDFDSKSNDEKWYDLKIWSSAEEIGREAKDFFGGIPDGTNDDDWTQGVLDNVRRFKRLGVKNIFWFIAEYENYDADIEPFHKFYDAITEWTDEDVSTRL